MPIVVFIQPRSLTAQQYEEIMSELQRHLSYPWDGLLNAVCYGGGDQLKVLHVWESQEKFEKFCEILIPAVSHFGIEIEPPKFAQAYASMEGSELKRYAKLA